MKQKSYTVEELVNLPSFQRWADGTADASEVRQWDRWIEQSEENREKSRQAIARLSGFDIDEPALPDLDEEWCKVEDNLKSDTFRSLNKFPVKAGYQRGLSWFFRWLGGLPKLLSRSPRANRRDRR